MYMFYDVLAQYEWIILWSSKNTKNPQKDPVTLFL